MSRIATDIFVGNVSVGVTPDLRGWDRRMRAELVPSSSRVGEEVGNTISRQIVDNMGKSGTQSADAFGTNFRKRLKAALEALPKAKLDADSTEADRRVEELRKRMEELLGKEIGVDLSAKDAMKEIALIDTGLEEVRRKSKDIPITFNTKEARAQLALLRRDSGTAGGRGGIGGLLGGGGAIAAAAPGGAPAAAPAGGGLAAMAGPVAIVAGIAAAIAALPFIAQAAAGAIVFALGGAFAGIGIIGAIMTGKLTKQWATFQENAKKDIEKIGGAFVPVLQHILTMASIILDRLTPVFSAIMHMIAGPFQAFVDAILTAFTSPAVINSMKAVAGAFVSILRAFTPEIPGIAKSLADSVSGLAHAISANPRAFADFLNFLVQIAIFAIRALQFLTEIANYIEQHWTPAIHRIAVVFDGVRHEVMHILDLMFNDTAGVVIRIAHNVETQFNSLRHQIAVIFDGIRHDIAHVWDQIFENSVGAVIRVWQKTNTPFASMRHSIASTFDGIRHDIAHTWDLIFQDTIGRVIRLTHNVESLLNKLRHDIAGIYDGIRHDISAVWDLIWNNTVSRALRGVQSVINVFVSLRNRAVSFFSNAASWLVNAGSNVIGGFLSGIASAMAGIGGWIKAHIVDPVINGVKHFFGISSPASAMIPVGRNIIAGVIQGMISHAANLGGFIGKIFGGWPQALGALVNKSLVNVAKLPAKALHALGSVAGKIGGFFAHLIGGSAGGGVSRWAGVVAQALAMLGLPLSLAPRVLYQMQTESGGNPNAINLTDINAQRGDPSRGLMQTIGGTFAAYHVAGTSSNIYDPLANVAAALNYARHVYGPNLMSGSMGVGSGHGYDEGGWLPPGTTMAVNRTGENELIMTADQLRARGRGGDGSAMYVAHFDGLTGQAIEGHVRTAFQAMSVTQGNLNRQGRRR